MLSLKAQTHPWSPVSLPVTLSDVIVLAHNYRYGEYESLRGVVRELLDRVIPNVNLTRNLLRIVMLQSYDEQFVDDVLDDFWIALQREWNL